MNREQFLKQLDYNDFSVGDTFFIEGIEFEVIQQIRGDIK